MFRIIKVRKLISVSKLEGWTTNSPDAKKGLKIMREIRSSYQLNKIELGKSIQMLKYSDIRTNAMFKIASSVLESK